MTVEKGNKAGISEEATTTSGVARSGGVDGGVKAPDVGGKRRLEPDDR